MRIKMFIKKLYDELERFGIVIEQSIDIERNLSTIKGKQVHCINDSDEAIYDLGLHILKFSHTIKFVRLHLPIRAIHYAEIAYYKNIWVRYLEMEDDFGNIQKRHDVLFVKA